MGGVPAAWPCAAQQQQRGLGAEQQRELPVGPLMRGSLLLLLLLFLLLLLHLQPAALLQQQQARMLQK